MSLSKNKKIILYLILIVIFSCSLINKTYAGDVQVIKVSGPSDNTVTVAQFSNPGTNKYFSFEFKVPKISGTPIPPNDIDAIYFEASVDGGKKEGKYIFNGKKTEYSGKTMTVSWNSSVQTSMSSKELTWSLYDYYTKTKYVDNKKFTFKIDENYSGYYYITTQKTENSYIYSLNGPYKEKGACELESKKGKEPNFKECYFSETLPTTPENKTIEKQNTNTTYTLLAPLPGLETIDTKNDETTNPCPFGRYLNIMIKLFLGIAAVLAVVMIVWGGIQYMTSELASSKEAGKESVTHAILGLLLALGAFIILNTLNPDLLNVCLNNLPKAEITISPESHEETIGISGKTTTVNGQTVTACNPSEITTLGSDGKTLTLFGSPIPGGVNKAVVKDIEAINTAWKSSNSAAIKNYKINTVGGGYVCRSVRGQTNKASAHAFGIAIDINPNTNPFQPGATTCTTDMPPEFVQLFKNQGWGWGGNWSSVKDAMHFSKLSTEVGYNNPCNKN